MTPRIVGIDSWSRAGKLLFDGAFDAMGQTPAFWGRYFCSQRSQKEPEYSRGESAFLAEHNVRVLPVARQTNNVGASASIGERDGRANAEDMIAELGSEAHLRATCPEVSAFLDVEGSGLSHLSDDYWLGWTRGLDAVAPGLFSPCIYGIPGDGKTWAALRSALARGGRCGGIWLSHPYVAKTEPVQWDAKMLLPFEAIEGVQVVMWQYMFPGQYAAANRQFDRNMLNPALADASGFLRTLPVPRVYV